MRAFVARILSASVLIGAGWSTAVSPVSAHQLARFHAFTCGDYETNAYAGGTSNIATTYAAAGTRDAAVGDDGSGGCYATGKWHPDSRHTVITFRWYVGKKLIRRSHGHKADGGRVDTLHWKHSFTLDDSGVRRYHGKKLTLRVTFKARGFKTVTLHTDPADDASRS